MSVPLNQATFSLLSRSCVFLTTLLFTSLSHFRTINGCVLENCTQSYCDKLDFFLGTDAQGKTIDQVPFQGIGNYFGAVYDTKAGINYEVYKTIQSSNVIATTTDASLKGCCNSCRTATGCVYYEFFKASGDAAKLSGGSYLKSGDKTKQCFLMGPKAGPNGRTLPESGNTATQNQNLASGKPASFFGGKCNPKSIHDPHMFGAHGTSFDFNGRPGITYCLMTDVNFHVNVRMDGYDAPYGALGFVEHPHRTWMEEVGVLWRYKGKIHSLYMTARGGNRQDRGLTGFLNRLEVDGLEIPKKRRRDGTDLRKRSMGLTIRFLSGEKVGGKFDVEKLRVEVAGRLTMDVNLRVAHPLLQTPDDAHVHFSLTFDSVTNTQLIHGVLGQTYRETEERRARSQKFSDLVSVLNKPVEADGESGKGFLDGNVDSYVSSGVLSADCEFSAFEQGPEAFASA